MKIQGFFDPTHIIRTFIANEYAFELQWINRPLVRIAHHKGTWFFAKIDQEGSVVDRFNYGDNGDLDFMEDGSKASPFVQGFIASRRNDKGDTTSRYAQAKVLVDLIHFWGGKLQEVDLINVVQPGRNATLLADGEFSLVPREDEWTK